MDCYIYQINFEEYDNYEKSFYLLFFLMGIGVPYDSTKLTDEEIRNIHLQKNYCSISINDLKRNIINKEYVFFGYIDFKHYSDDKIASIFKFLIDKQILIYDADRDRYNLKNPKFQRFINNCWSILCQRTFRIMFEYIYTYIRKPQENENEWLKLLFDKNANNMFEREYHKKRSERKELLKNKDVNSPEIKLIKGENLITNLKLILNRLNSDINWLKKEYLESSFDNEHLFFINRILTIIYPEFIQKDDFIKNLKIKSNKNY